MGAGEGEARGRMVEVGLHVLPARRRVAGVAVAAGERVAVRAVGSVAALAGPAQSEVGIVEVPGRRDEPADGGVGDVVRPVARAALDSLVPADEPEARPVVFEVPRVEADGVEVAPEVVPVTRAAVAREACVKPPARRDARPQRRVAGEALRRVDAPLADAVAARAVADPLQRGV